MQRTEIARILNFIYIYQKSYFDILGDSRTFEILGIRTMMITGTLTKSKSTNLNKQNNTHKQKEAIGDW